MLIDNKEVQLSDFTVDTDINKVSFKQSSGRTSHRSRSLSYRSKLSLEFEDADTATEFVEDITALEVIPMVLEENDISPYGDELEVSGGAPIPAVYVDSFIGNGVDSGVNLGNINSVPPFIMASTKIVMGVSQTTDIIFNFGGVETNSFYLVGYTQGGEFQVFSGNSIRGESWSAPLVLVAGERYSIQFSYSDATGVQVWINGIEQALTNIYLGGIQPQPTTLELEIGLNQSGTQVSDSTIYDTYWSDNLNSISPSSVAKYAEDPTPQGGNRPFYLGRELYTQVAPDALIGDWLGGAVQGQIEISPEVPGAEILNFYLERAPTFKVDGYNNVTVELRTLLSKDNITYPTTYNSTILDTLPYDWKYRENIYTQFNNNTTLAGINYNTQNSTTGRSLRLQFRLLKTEYLELRKFIFNKRYTPFAYNSLVGGFAVNTMMVIGNYSMSFTGKLYNITLILEEQ